MVRTARTGTPPASAGSVPGRRHVVDVAVFALVVLLLSALSACGAVSPSHHSPSPDEGAVVASVRRPAANPVMGADGGAHNVVFYYQGDTPLLPRHVPRLRRELGHPSVLVTTRQTDPTRAVRAIHELGAKAYLYVQYYWAPDDREYAGIDLQRHPGWAFCGSGSKPILGRVTPTGEKWYMLDANERGLRAQIRRLMAQYKQQGWDGVMFDRGAASTQLGAPLEGVTLWYARSTCTQHPFRPAATFSDAYVNLLALAQDVGLQVMANNGRSPFDASRPMRADPRDGACRRAQWHSCTFVGDIWRNANLVLNETPSHVTDSHWWSDFLSNRASEKDPAHGGRTVALITTVDVGGPSGQNRHTVYYEWSQVKLFNLAVGVNTGTGSCPAEIPPNGCNQYGVYPELVDIRFGPPLTSTPKSLRCLAHHPRDCVWFRLYQRGASVVNVSPEVQRRVRLRLGVPGCRYVYDVLKRRALAGNRCVSSVSLRLAPWSGRPLTYSESPF